MLRSSLGYNISAVRAAREAACLACHVPLITGFKKLVVVLHWVLALGIGTANRQDVLDSQQPNARRFVPKITLDQEPQQQARSHLEGLVTWLGS